MTKNIFLTKSLCWTGAEWCMGPVLVADWCPVLSLVVRAAVSAFFASSSSQQVGLSLCLEHLRYPKPPPCVGSSSYFAGLNKQSDEGRLEMALFQGAHRALQGWELGSRERMRWGCCSPLVRSSQLCGLRLSNLSHQPSAGRDGSQFIWCVIQMKLRLIKQIQGASQAPFCCCCCLWVCCQGCLTTLTNVLNKWQAALAGFPCTSNVLLEVNPAVPLPLGRDGRESSGRASCLVGPGPPSAGDVHMEPP